MLLDTAFDGTEPVPERRPKEQDTPLKFIIKLVETCGVDSC
jgi:hypothetical protein